MAITTKAETLGRHVFITSESGMVFAVNATSPDITAGEVVKTAVSGKSIYLQRYEFQLDGDVTGWFGERLTGSATGTVTRIIGPIMFDTDIPVVHAPPPFLNPIKVTTGYDLVMDSSGAASAYAYIEGFSA